MIRTFTPLSISPFLRTFLAWIAIAGIATTPLAGQDRVAAGAEHSLYIDADGDVYAWGDNGKGQLGIGSTADTSTPQIVEFSESSVPVDGPWIHVSAGQGHSVALHADGSLWAWGSNSQGQIGRINAAGDAGGAPQTVYTRPVRINDDTDWMDVSAGAFHTLAIKSDGSLWAWGSNAFGQAGLRNLTGDVNDPAVSAFVAPVKVSADGESFLAVAAGKSHSLAIRDSGDGQSGELLAWGSNDVGQLGFTSGPTIYTPIRVGTAIAWNDVVAGDKFSLATQADGTLWGWGNNQRGQVGIGPDATNQLSPRQVLLDDTARASLAESDRNDTGWIDIAAGKSHALARKQTSAGIVVFGWGSNSGKELGIAADSVTNAFSPRLLASGATGWLAIDGGSIGTASDSHSLLVAADGLPYVAGSGSKGQLGLASVSRASTFQAVPLSGETGVSSPDFTISQLSIDSDSQEITVGQDTAFSVTVRNLGGDYLPGANPAIVTVYLSADSELDESDEAIGNASLSGVTILGQQSRSVDGTFFLDLATSPGDYFVIAEVDSTGVVAELNEDNNAQASSGAFEVFAQPEFSVASFSASFGELRPEGTITLDLGIENAGGTYPASAATLSAEVVFTADETVGNADDVSLGVLSLPGPLNSGETTLFRSDVTLPADIDAGTYSVAVVLDPAGVVEEGNRDDNTFLDSQDVEMLPDFTLLNLSVAEGTLSPGDTVNYSFTVGNEGANFTANSAIVEMTVVLTTDDVVGDADDIAVDTLTFTAGLPFEDFEFVNASSTVPLSFPSGSYRLGVRINTGDPVLGEISTDNNVDVSDDSFAFFPDFVISEFIIPTTTRFVPGQEVGFKVVVTNQGGRYDAADGETITVRVRLSPTGSYDSGTIELTDTIEFSGSLGSGEEYSDSESFTLPSSINAGTYFVTARVDPGDPGIPGDRGVVPELNDFNNDFVSAQSFSLLSDLVVSAFTVTGGSYARGDTVPFSGVEVSNISAFDLPAGTSVNLEAVISSDLSLGDFNDSFLLDGYTFTNGLPAGSSVAIPDDTGVPFAAQVASSAPAGNYYTAIRVDSALAIPESNDSNNTLFSALPNVVVLGADLGESLEDHLDPGDRRNPDPLLGGDSSWFGQDLVFVDPLGVGNATAAQSGPVGDNGESYFEFSIFVDEASRLSFFWAVSSETNFDELIFTVNGVIPDQVLPISGIVDFTEVGIDLAPGSYTLRWTYRKDDSTSKNADAAWVDGIEISPADPDEQEFPDFVVTSAEYQPATYVALRDAFAFDAIGQNIGDDLVPIPEEGLFVDAVLSIDQEFGNGDDIVLGRLQISEPVDGNDTFFYSEEVLTPSRNRRGEIVPASQAYYLGLRIDPFSLADLDGNFTEADETNNTFWSASNDIVVETRADISLENFSYTNGIFYQGDEIQLSFEMVNRGLRNIPAGTEFELAVQTSTNDGGNDTALTTVTFDQGLSIGQTRFIQMTVTIPEGTESQPDCRLLNVFADTTGVIDEIDEVNNSTGNNILDVGLAGIAPGVALDYPSLRWDSVAAGCEVWTGESDGALDGIDVVQNPILEDNEFTQLTTTVFIDKPTFVQFAWSGDLLFRLQKGEEDLFYGVLEEEGGGFALYRQALEGGDFYTFTFTYGEIVADAPLFGFLGQVVSPGESIDIGGETLIDNFELTFPEVELTEFTVPAQTLDREESIDVAGGVLSIANSGERDIPASTPFDFQFRLSPDQEWGDDDDIVVRSPSLGLLRETYRIQLEESLEASDPAVPRNVEQLFQLKVPEFTPPGNYFLGVEVNLFNFNEQFPEVDNDNNRRWTTSRVITIPETTDTLSVAEALDQPDREIGRSTEIPWFGQSAVTFDGVDAARTPFLEEGKSSWISLDIEGPAEVGFWWKSELLTNINTLSATVDGVLQANLTGTVDWTVERIAIPPGTHTLSFVYQKGRDVEGSDVGYVDGITIDKFDLTIADVTFGNQTAARGENVTGSFSVENIGQSAIGSARNIEGQVFLTADAEIGNVDDLFLGTFALTADLGAGASQVIAFPDDFAATIPDTANPGAYGIAVVIDSGNAISEVEEENNAVISFSSTVTVDALSFDDATSLSVTFDPPVTPQLVLEGDAAWYGDDAETNDDPGAPIPGAVRSPSMVQGESARFGYDLDGPFRITFDWKLDSDADTFAFEVDGIAEATLTGEADWQTAEFILNSAEQARSLRWVHTRANSENLTDAGIAYVDNIEIEGLLEPDLTIATLDYEAGTYVLQQGIPLDVAVVGINIGREMPDTDDQFEVEVRLSTDLFWGNSDDIVLGRLNTIDRIEDSGRFIYTQRFDLDQRYVEGDYYLGAFVDSAEQIDEFRDSDDLTTTNNILFSESPDITLDRRPLLRITDVNYRAGEYLRDGEMELQFSIRNDGFEDFPTGGSFDLTIEMNGSVFDSVTDNNMVTTINEIEQPILTRTLRTLTITSGGISEGSQAIFTTSLQLPEYDETTVIEQYGFGRLEIDDPTTSNQTTFGPLPVQFALDMDLDTEVQLVFTNPTRLGSHNFTIESTPFLQDYDEFVTFWDPDGDFASLLDETADTDGDGFTNLEEFAFGLAPTEANALTRNNDGSPVAGTLVINGSDYLSLTFNALSDSANGAVTYTVEADDDAGFPSPETLAVVSPLDSEDDIRDLGSFVTLIDNGYLFRVTVRDSVSLADAPGSRFIRLVISIP